MSVFLPLMATPFPNSHFLPSQVLASLILYFFFKDASRVFFFFPTASFAFSSILGLPWDAVHVFYFLSLEAPIASECVWVGG